MTTHRDQVLDRVADLLEPDTDSLAVFHRRIERRARNRRIGGIAVGAAFMAVVVFVALGSRVPRPDVSVGQTPIELAKSTDGDAWSLYAVASSDGTRVTVGGPDRSMAIALDVPEDLADDGLAFTAPSEGKSGFVVGVVGPLVESVNRIDARGSSGVPLYRVPTGREWWVRAFILPVERGSTGWFVTDGQVGEDPKMFAFAPGMTCGVTNECVPEPETTLLVDAADDGTVYRVVLAPNGAIVMVDDRGVELGRAPQPTRGSVEAVVTDVTNRDQPVVLGVASAGFTNVWMVGTFEGEGDDELMEANSVRLQDGRVAFLAYRYAFYFKPHTILFSDATCSSSLALSYPSLERVHASKFGLCG